MARVASLAMAVVLAVTAIAIPSPVVPVARAASPVGVGDIVAGSVGRSSLNLDARYDTYLRLRWASGAIWVNSVATIRNTAGGPIDRIEFNTIAARLGGLRIGVVTVDGVAVRPTISDQTVVVPLGGILPSGGSTRIRITFGAQLRSGLAGSDWLFTKANGIVDLYRWLPWVSRRIAFSRPNHGDTFATPSS